MTALRAGTLSIDARARAFGFDVSHIGFALKGRNKSAQGNALGFCDNALSFRATPWISARHQNPRASRQEDRRECARKLWSRFT
jgi:hypothetical protein